MFFFRALEAQSSLGGEDLIPFYGLMEGGRQGELYTELEDYFYYAQIRRFALGLMFADIGTIFHTSSL